MKNEWVTVLWKNDEKTLPKRKNLVRKLDRQQDVLIELWELSSPGANGTLCFHASYEHRELSLGAFPDWQSAQEAAVAEVKRRLLKEKGKIEEKLATLEAL